MRSALAPSSATLVLAVLGIGLGPVPARAQDVVGGSLELSMGHALDDVNRARYGLGLGGALFFEARPTPLVGLQLGGAATWLSASQSVSDTHWLAVLAGARLHLGVALGWDGDLFVDVHANYGSSGGRGRWGGDAGLGLELPLDRAVRLGPYLRLHWSEAPQSDPVWAQLGVSVSLGALSAAPPSDTDGDGVPDDEDACPDEPAGSTPDPARPGCPLRDRDSDGVEDAADACPDEPAGPTPDALRPGCPAPVEPATPPVTDRDGDGFSDPVDGCPDAAEVQNGFEDDDGCPDEVPRAPEPIRFSLDHRVLFDTNRARIRAAARPAIAAIAEMILAHPEWELIRVEGHADTRGPEAFNERLSEQRALRVIDALVEAGVPRERFAAVAHGEARPLAAGESDEAHERNRRVEFTVISQRAVE